MCDCMMTPCCSRAHSGYRQACLELRLGLWIKSLLTFYIQQKMEMSEILHIMNSLENVALVSLDWLVAFPILLKYMKIKVI